MDVIAQGIARRALRNPTPPLVECSGHSYLDESSYPWAFGRRAANLLGARNVVVRGYGGSIISHPNRSGVGDGGHAWLERALMRAEQSEFYAPWYNSVGAAGGAPYAPRGCVHIHSHAINDIAQLGPSNLRPMLEAHRAVWSRMCASKLWASNTGTTSILALTGTWANASDSLGQESGAGPAGKRTTTLNDLATFTIPSDVPSGRVAAFRFTVQPTDDVVVTFKQNGTTIKTVTVQGSAICDPALTSGFMGNAFVVRLGKPGDGITIAPGDVLVAQMTTKNVGGMTLAATQIEADPRDGPVIVVPLPNHLLAAGYQFYVTNTFAQAAAMNDAAIDTAKTALASALAEFDGATVKRTLAVDLDTAQWLGTAADAKNFYADGLHPNPQGAGIIAEAVASGLRSSGLLTPRICGRAVHPLPSFWYPFNGSTFSGASSLGGVGWSNSWTNFDPRDTTGTPTQLNIRYPGFRRDEHGGVELRGRLTPGTSAAVAFRLPRGFATTVNRQYPLAVDQGQAFAEVRAGAGNGGSDVVITYTGAPTWISLDNVQFRSDW